METISKLLVFMKGIHLGVIQGLDDFCGQPEHADKNSRTAGDMRHHGDRVNLSVMTAIKWKYT